MTLYCITSSADTRWHDVPAKTLTAAKTAASKYYHRSVGGKILVGVRDDVNNYRYPVAVTYGHCKKWINIEV